MKKFWKKKKVIFPALAGAVLLIAIFCYINDYYHSDESVQEYLNSSGAVSIKEVQDGLYLDGPGEDSAMIFYPGAKVEYTAYLPLFYKLADQGVDCFLIKMPCNLAFLGKNKAENIMNSYDYKCWYLSGHSLGGAMAASYAGEHLESLDGVVLLAAYPTKSLKADSFSVLSIYGSEDGVLSMEKVEDGREFMPSNYAEICIEGGNHAFFGNYGNQDGDRDADISREEQQNQTVTAILQMVEGHKERKQEEVGMSYQQITPQEAKEIMDTETNIVILDVRTQEEYANGHIKNAVCLANEEIKSEQPEILPDKKQKILVYCRSGNRVKSNFLCFMCLRK